MADEQLPEHKCPYDGLRSYDNRNWLCGSRGHLCHRCREDRADARVQIMVREMFAVLQAEWDRLESEEAADA